MGNRPGSARPIGVITRGTTNPNRLRRADRWLLGPQAWRWAAADAPVIVDLGFGASPVTTLELADRLRGVNASARVVGIEIDPGRVAAAELLLAQRPTPGVHFAPGGFEIPLPSGVPATVIRAANVLRQYPEDEVEAAWATLTGRLSANGLVMDLTCDEVGRRATWIALDRSGPLSLTLSARLRSLERPSDLAERLPKALIHRNRPGEPVHDLLTALDDAWDRQAALASFGRRQRFVAMAQQLRADGWPVLDGPARWRLGELTVAWSALAS